MITSKLPLLSLLAFASAAVLLAAGSARAETAPVIRAKVSVMQGLPSLNVRCDDSFAANARGPVDYRLSFVNRGQPLGYEVRLRFASELRSDGKAEVTVERTVLVGGKLDRKATKSTRLVVKKGDSESTRLTSRFGGAFAAMLVPLKVEVAYDGESDEVGAPRGIGCGQVFLEN